MGLLKYELRGFPRGVGLAAEVAAFYLKTRGFILARDLLVQDWEAQELIACFLRIQSGKRGSYWLACAAPGAGVT